MDQSRFAYSPNESINFRTVGSGARQLLLLHGFGASLLTWHELLPFFPPHEYTLHLLDLKGHGASKQDLRGDFSVAHNSRIVSAYAHSQGLASVTIIGHSMGGAVAMLTALELPQTERLILIGAPLYPQKLPRFMHILSTPLIGPLLMMVIPARLIAFRALQEAYYRLDLINEQLVQRYARFYHAPASLHALGRTARQIIPPDIDQIIERIKTLTLPALLIWGEQDRIVRPQQGEKLHALLSNSRLVTIPDCGHNPHEERPEETYTLIRDFLSGVIE